MGPCSVSFALAFVCAFFPSRPLQLLFPLPLLFTVRSLERGEGIQIERTCAKKNLSVGIARYNIRFSSPPRHTSHITEKGKKEYRNGNRFCSVVVVVCRKRVLVVSSNYIPFLLLRSASLPFPHSVLPLPSSLSFLSGNRVLFASHIFTKTQGGKKGKKQNEPIPNRKQGLGTVR